SCQNNEIVVKKNGQGKKIRVHKNNVENTTKNILLEDDEGKDEPDDTNVNNNRELSKQELKKDNGKLDEDCLDNGDEMPVVKKNNEKIDLDCTLKTYLPESKELDTIAAHDEAYDCYFFRIGIKKDEDTIKGRKIICEWALKPVIRNKIASDENCKTEGPLILKSETNQVVKVKSSRLEGKLETNDKRAEPMPIERKLSTEKEADEIKTCESKPKKLIQEERKLICKDIDEPNLRETAMQIKPELPLKKEDDEVEKKPNENNE
ncbi:9388_t:CDS:2, partial [Scutellospora calospora]